MREKLNNQKDRNQKTLSVNWNFVFTLLFIFFSLIKLWLVSGDEIVARYQPHDEFWYISAADNLINLNWLGPYGPMTLIRPPGYPAWIAIINNSGIPLRVANELLLFSSALAFSYSLKKAQIPTFLCFISYLLIIFHPWTFTYNNEVLSETLYLPMLLFSLSCMLMMSFQIKTQKRFYLALITGLILGILWNTRAENILILTLLAFYGFLEFVVLFKKKETYRNILRHIIIIVFFPLLVIASLTITIRAINYFKYGVFITSEMQAPGFNSAIKALLRIKPNEVRRFTPLTSDMLEKAYEFSPAMQKIRPFLDKTNLNSPSFFVWNLHWAGHAGGGSAKQIDETYQQISNEINNACKKGMFSCNRATLINSLGTLHPYPSTYIPYLAKSFLETAKRFYNTNIKVAIDVMVNQGIQNTFDSVANRRSSLNPNIFFRFTGPVTISGWAVGLNEPITKIFLRDGSGETMASTDQFIDRPDVVNAFVSSSTKRPPKNNGFSLTFLKTKKDFSNFNLVMATTSGKEYSIPFDQFNKQSRALANEVSFNIESVRGNLSSNKSKHKIMKFLHVFYSFKILIFILPLFLIFLFFNKEKHFRLKWYLISFLTFVLVSRVFLFSIVEASSYHIDERYLYPAMPILISLILIISYEGTRGAFYCLRPVWSRLLQILT